MALLDGTRVLVTGATSGLGRAMAQALVDAGAAVAVTSRDRTRGEATATELGETAVGLALDVRDEESVRAGVAEAYERLGGVDMLVNNAGISSQAADASSRSR